jgi:Uncharacterized protein conserved in bacteria
MGSGSIPGLHALGETVAQLTRPLIGDRRAPLAELRGAWREIVGGRLASLCQPSGLARGPRAGGGGTLQLQVASGAVALQLQHEAPLLLGRINSCLGYPAVARLKLIHAPPPPAGTARNARPQHPRPDGRAALSVPLDSIDDPRLRASLARLARRLADGDSPLMRLNDRSPACSDDTPSR